MTWAVLTTVIIGYLVGSIPAATWWARRRAAIDLRSVGDRNPGYWNARQQLGTRSSWPVFVFDVTKGVVGAGTGWILAGDLTSGWLLPVIGGGAAMVGHAWPVWSRGRGGRSVLTFVGTVMVTTPVATAVAIALTIAVRVLTRRFDVAARVGIFSVPFLQLVVDGPWRTAATGVLMTFIGLRFAQAALQSRSVPASPATADPAA